MCSLPWEKRHGLPGVNEAKLTILGTTFGYFRTNDCGLKVVADPPPLTPITHTLCHRVCVCTSQH